MKRLSNRSLPATRSTLERVVADCIPSIRPTRKQYNIIPSPLSSVRRLPPQVQHVQPRERPILPQVRFSGCAAETSAWAKELTLGSFAHHVKILVSTSVVVCPLTVSHLHRPPSTGHSGKHGHEFLEFEYSHGRLRYANNSNYRNDSLIRKESTRHSTASSALSLRFLTPVLP